VGAGLTVERSVSYRELEQSSLRLAAVLRTAARTGDRALLLFPPGIEYVMALLGCLCAGIIAVPLYPPRPGAKLDRIASVIRSCRPSLALTTATMAPLLDPLRSSGLAVGTIEAMLAAGEHAGQVDVSPQDIAFLQYTSGSTGDPKGVMVSHRNLLENELAIATSFAVRPTDVILSWLPLYHDMGLIGTALLPLCLGLQTVLLDTLAFLHDPLTWPLAMAKFGATCSGGPNFGYRLLCDRYDPARMTGSSLGAWRIAFNGAEPVDQETMDSFAAAYGRHGFSATSFYPCYGLAEATLFVSGSDAEAGYHAGVFDRRAFGLGRLAPVSEAAGTGAGQKGRVSAITVVSSGTACQGTRVTVRSEKGDAVEDGLVGEICVQGPGVTQGYWDDPGATAKVYGTGVAGQEGTFLCTGDLGALLDGRLYVVGRIKDLIIVAGRNFHPHDIERVAEAADPVLRKGCAAAVQLADAERSVILVAEVRSGALAHLRADSGAARDLGRKVRSDVAAECGLELADIVLVLPGSVPKTSSGKLRRAETMRRFLAGRLEIVGRSRSAAARDEQGEPDLRSVQELPPGDREEVLRALLQDTVAVYLGARPGHDQLGVPLASLGFDSLRLVTLKGAVEQRLGCEVDAGLFWGDRSLDEVASAIAAAAPGRASPGSPGVRGRSVPVAGPMTEGQVHLQFYDQLFPDDVANNLPCALRLDRRVPQARLHAAVAVVVGRHPALRTRMGTPGNPTQTVGHEASFDWRVRELDDHDQAGIRRFFAEVAYTRFDPGHGALVRAAAVLASGQTTLLLVCHHSIVDHWSLQIVMAQIVAEIADSDEPALFGAQDASAIEWAQAEARALGQDQARDRLASLAAKWRPWRDELLLPERQRRARRRNPAATVDFEIGAELTARLYERSNVLGFTTFVTIAAAYLAALHRITGRPRVTIGTPYHGRANWRYANTVGYLINLIPLPGDFSDGASVREVEERTWRELRRALATADIPFSRLIKAINPQRHGESPLVQATLTLHQSASSLLQDGFAVPWSHCRQAVSGLAVEAFDVPPRDVAFAFSLYGARDGARMVFRLAYQMDLIEAAMARRLGQEFQAALLELALTLRRAETEP
jgi:acyl-CoA synthetase (AMP-forming)/AMP-acid ligase II/acyl carrier protein